MRLTRNQVCRKVPGVRIPPSPPAFAKALAQAKTVAPKCAARRRTLCARKATTSAGQSYASGLARQSVSAGEDCRADLSRHSATCDGGSAQHVGGHYAAEKATTRQGAILRFRSLGCLLGAIRRLLNRTFRMPRKPALAITEISKLHLGPNVPDAPVSDESGAVSTPWSGLSNSNATMETSVSGAAPGSATSSPFGVTADATALPPTNRRPDRGVCERLGKRILRSAGQVQTCR